MDAASSETPASSGSEIAMDIASSETPPSSGDSGSERTLDEASPPSSGSEGTVDGHSPDSNAASNHVTVTKPGTHVYSTCIATVQMHKLTHVIILACAMS